MAKLTTIYTTLLLWVTLVAARSRELAQPPTSVAVPGRLTSQGCYGSLPAVALGEHMVFASVGACSNRCMQRYKSVTILHLDVCFCSDTYPPRRSLVDDARCNSPCPGYAMEACGGRNPDAYGVFNTGLNPDVEHDSDDADDHQHPSGQCHSALTSINDAAESIFSAAKDFAKKVQILIGDTLGQTQSDDTDKSVEEAAMPQEAEDLKI